MTEALKIAAQDIMDAYYQDYASDDSFFSLEDFAGWIGKAYGKMADAVAKQIYDGSRAETGTGQIVFSQDWWAKKKIQITNNRGKVDFEYIGFTYDNQNSGIQEIFVGECNTVRTTLTEKWIADGVGKANVVYWYPDFDEIALIPKGECTPKDITVYYIPSPEDENFKVPKSVEFDIATMAFNFMISAKKETPFIDSTNDGNKNTAQATEANATQAQPVKK